MNTTMTYQQSKQGFEVYWGELPDMMIEIPKPTYDAAPTDRRDDPAYWRELLLSTPSMPMDIEPIPDVTHVCRICYTPYRYSADDLAWKFEVSPFAPCGDRWQFVVPFIQIPFPQTYDDARMERDIYGASYLESHNPWVIESGADSRGRWEA